MGILLTCRTREMPPPPPGLVQASSWNLLPSISSTAAQMASCAFLISASKRPRMLQEQHSTRVSQHSYSK